MHLPIASMHACALTHLALGHTAAHAAAVVPAVLLAGVVQELRLHVRRQGRMGGAPLMRGGAE